MSITHAKVSAKSDGGDGTLVLPSDWNADHTVALGGTPAPVLSTTNSAGNATTYMRTNDQLALFDATAPSTQAFGDAAATGSAAIAARRDHKHAMPAAPTTIANDTVWAAAGDIAVASANDTAAVLTKGTSGTFLQAGASTVAYADVYIPVTFSKQGVVAVTTESTALRWYNDSGRTLTIQSVRASANTAPTGASLIVDVNYDGTTIYTTGPGTNRPTITATNFTAEQGAPSDVTAVADQHYLSVNVDQVGSTIAGSDLTVQIWLRG